MLLKSSGTWYKYQQDNNKASCGATTSKPMYTTHKRGETYLQSTKERSLLASYPKAYIPTTQGSLERLRRARKDQEGMERGWDARGSQSKQVKGRKEERRDFIEKGKIANCKSVGKAQECWPLNCRTKNIWSNDVTGKAQPKCRMGWADSWHHRQGADETRHRLVHRCTNLKP